MIYINTAKTNPRNNHYIGQAMVLTENKENEMNVARKQVEQKYNAALAVWNVAAGGNDLDAYNTADAILKAARTELIAIEEKFPTTAESKRASRKQWLRQIGMDA